MAFAVTEGFYSRHFFKVQTNVETCHPRNPPGLASPNHPPLARGALVRCSDKCRSNDTGRVREITITDQLGAHCHRGHPGGGSPEMLKRNLQIPLAFFRGLGYIIEVLALRCFEC